MNVIRRIGTFVGNIGENIILLITFPIFVGLTYYSMRYTEILKPEQEIPMTVADSLLENVFIFVSVLLCFWLLGTIVFPKMKNSMDKLYRGIVIGVIIYVTVVSVFWVSICHVVPRADGANLCLIAQLFLESDEFSFMNPPGYMAYCPHQYSLLSVIQFLFTIFGSGNYQAFMYLNALCMPLLFYSGYKLLCLISDKREVVLYYSALFINLLPLFFYVSYVYGEIISTTFTMVFMWQVVKFCKTGKNICCLWGTSAILFACIVRMNSFIVVIAATIVLIVHALRNMKWRPIIWMMLSVLLVLSVDEGIKTYYEETYEQEIKEGIPYVSYILMGLEDGEEGPGWFNGTNYRMFNERDYNAEWTTVDSIAYMKARWNEIWKNKAYGIDFFKRKVLSQWNSPAYHSIYETGIFDCEQEELPQIVQWIYYDNVNTVNNFMDRYQFILYLCTAVSIGATLFRRKRTVALENQILLIAILGGVIFSAMWEAMSRYVISYVVYMIPLAAIGMWQLQAVLNVVVRKILEKCKKREAA